MVLNNRSREISMEKLFCLRLTFETDETKAASISVCLIGYRNITLKLFIERIERKCHPCAHLTTWTDKTFH